MSPSLFASHEPSMVARALPRFGARLRALLGRLFMIGLLGLLLGGVGWVGWRLHSFVFRSDYFELRQVDVALGEATARLDAPERLERRVRQSLYEAGLDEGNLLRIDREAAMAAVAKMAWVKSVRVTKHYPARLSVWVEPREIEALVLHDPLLAVDGEGVVVEALTTRHRLAADYPFVTGLEVRNAALGKALPSESLTKSLELLSCLRGGNPSLYAQVSEVHCDREKSLVLVLKGGTRIRFGADNPVRKMPNLETFIARQGRPEDYAYIDLRFDGQIPFLTKQRAAAQGESGPREDESSR